MPSTNGRTRYGRTCTSPGPNRLRAAARSRYRLRIRAKGENGACGRSLSHSAHSAHAGDAGTARSEEHTTELQSPMRISYAVFRLNNKKFNPLPSHNTLLTPNPHTYIIPKPATQ